MSFFLCGCVSQPEEENLVQEKNTYRGKRNCLHQRHGKGKYLYENGDIYEGDWKNNKMHGYGQYRTPSGIMLIGFFENDEFVGPQRKVKGTTNISKEKHKPKPIAIKDNSFNRSSDMDECFLQHPDRRDNSANPPVQLTEREIAERQAQYDLKQEKHKIRQETVLRVRTKYGKKLKRRDGT